jgi:hypothetical protein
MAVRQLSHDKYGCLTQISNRFHLEGPPGLEKTLILVTVTHFAIFYDCHKLSCN